jgi:tetratricopeptide (TPR) repeat protein
MTANFDTGDRDVVPRWRSVRRTIEAGEFQTCPPRSLDRNHEAQLRVFEEAWRRSPSRLTAVELVEASLVANAPERARSAADRLLRRDGLVGVMARRATTGDVPHPLPDTHGELPHRAYQRIARTKQKLLANPRSAILWGDLARRYTSLGQFDQAKHALQVARILAPNSRYLLRSQVRFLVHVDRADEAVSVLQRHPRTLGDPWLMAALLSVSEQADRPLPGKKHIRRLLDDDGFRPIERSELASEAGTLELRSGATRMATRLLSAALTNPTDNSLAQVEWVSNRFDVLEVDLEQFAVPFPDEARTRSAVQAGKWEEALFYAEAWMDDQPFDAGAAVLGSYVASVGLEDWERAILTAQAGLLASPTLAT